VFLKSLHIEAVIQDLYDFDWTREASSNSRIGATVQIGWQSSSRNGGKIFATETELNNTYTGSSINPLNAINHFNRHHHLNATP
ncbi:MAG: hypothetical protein Q8M07_14375, partial [Prosthecobacter sp.]|nr:hypothetical protein [Prosthecobacter sp.]